MGLFLVVAVLISFGFCLKWRSEKRLKDKVLLHHGGNRNDVQLLSRYYYPFEFYRAKIAAQNLHTRRQIEGVICCYTSSSTRTLTDGTVVVEYLYRFAPFVEGSIYFHYDAEGAFLRIDEFCPSYRIVQE